MILCVCRNITDQKIEDEFEKNKSLTRADLRPIFGLPTCDTCANHIKRKIEELRAAAPKP